MKSKKDSFSTTRSVPSNYEKLAATSTALGEIEIEIVGLEGEWFSDAGWVTIGSK